MKNKLIDYIEKILIENTSIDMWSDVYLPSIQDAYEEEYEKSIFNYFIEKIHQYNDQNKICVLQVILSYNDPSNFDLLLEKLSQTKDKEVIETLIAYLIDWSLTEEQKQKLNKFYKNSGAQSRFGDMYINELNKKK